MMQHGLTNPKLNFHSSNSFTNV